DQDIVPTGAVQWIGGGEDHRVELLAPAGREEEGAVGQLHPGRGDRGEPALARWRRKRATRSEVAPTPLHRVAGGAQRLDSGVERDHRRDLLAQRLVRRPRETVGQVGPDAGSQLGEDAPLAARLADLMAGDLRREDDASLGRRFGAAALLLVARGRREEDDPAAV